MRRQIVTLALLTALLSGCEDLGITTSLKDSEVLEQILAAAEDSEQQSFTPDSGKGFKSITLDIGTDFKAANICSGKTLFKLPGTAECSSCSSIMYSTANRTVGSTQIRASSEITTYAGKALPANYRTIPSIFKDDEGTCPIGTASGTCTTNSPVRPVPVAAHNAFQICGTTQPTIAERIEDCRVKNGIWATWDGAKNGVGGETVWRLVTVALNLGQRPYAEVWLDTATGLLWSSKSSGKVLKSPASDITKPDAAPWCAAAGNNDSTDPAGATNNNYCRFNKTSYCAETLSSGAAPIPGVGFPGDNFSSRTYDPAKGGMGKFSTPSVRWRLPTRNDFYLADVHGIRFVMPDMGHMAFTNDSPESEWTATLAANYSNRTAAYGYESARGLSSPADRNTTEDFYVRCVGR